MEAGLGAKLHELFTNSIGGISLVRFFVFAKVIIIHQRVVRCPNVRILVWSCFTFVSPELSICFF